MPSTIRAAPRRTPCRARSATSGHERDPPAVRRGRGSRRCSRRRSTTGSRQIAAMFTASWKAPWFTAPSPKKAAATRRLAEQLARQAGADRERHAGPHDRVGAQDPARGIGDAHRAALAAAEAGLLREQLGHRGAGTHALGKRVSVRAMRGRDPVVTRQHIAHANRHRLLPLVLVQRSRDLTVKKQPVDTLFEPADKQHLPVPATPSNRCRPAWQARCRPHASPPSPRY